MDYFLDTVERKVGTGTQVEPSMKMPEKKSHFCTVMAEKVDTI